MRIVAISILALTALSGCLSLHANVPGDVIRRHMAHEEGVELGAICSHEGQSFSEGAIVCMADRRMTCDSKGRWEKGDAC